MLKWLLLAALGYCSTALAEPPRPLLWQVSDADNSVYLLGSFHLLKPGDYPLAATVNKTFEKIEKIYFEIPAEQINDPELQKKMLQQGLLSRGKTLQQSIKPETWARLENYCAARKLDPAKFQSYKPWLLSLVISLAEMQQAGLQPAFGLDQHFMKLARTSGKQVDALENADAQLALFDSMHAEEQEQALLQTLEESENMRQHIEELHQLWRNGDADGIVQLTSRELLAKAPELYQRIFVARNHSWLPQITAFLKDNSSDDALVIVGSMHLLGTDGLVNLLQQQGYRVTRIP